MDRFVNKRLIRLALEEDIGPGDMTTEGLVEPGILAKAVIVAKEPFVLAGLELAQDVFTTLDPATSFVTPFKDGDMVKRGDIVLETSGKLRVLLTGERTALNFCQRLSGIATYTRQFVEKTKGFSVRVTDTRKTTPGWRRLEKYAVKIGGAYNHRFGLYDGILIKDNHITACGSISEAVKRIRKTKGHLLCIEVEVTNLEEVKEALKNSVDIIMLDNMNLTEIKRAVTLVEHRVLVEVSGGITLESVVQLAATGVDIISIGALTHSARAVDMSMQLSR